MTFIDVVGGKLKVGGLLGREGVSVVGGVLEVGGVSVVGGGPEYHKEDVAACHVKGILVSIVTGNTRMYAAGSMSD